MIGLATVIVTLILLFGYFLFAPFYIEINTANNLYRLRFHRLASASINYREPLFYIIIKIAWWQKQYELFPFSERVPAASNKQIIKKNIPLKKLLRQFKNILLTFKIRTCYITIDTGNMALNGVLYPVFYLLSSKFGKTIQINFYGEIRIDLQIENSIAGMLWAYIRS